jgi:hypothetical protein
MPIISSNYINNNNNISYNVITCTFFFTNYMFVFHHLFVSNIQKLTNIIKTLSLSLWQKLRHDKDEGKLKHKASYENMTNSHMKWEIYENQG